VLIVSVVEKMPSSSGNPHVLTDPSKNAFHEDSGWNQNYPIKKQSSSANF
jgi:hypothetical protein